MLPLIILRGSIFLLHYCFLSRDMMLSPLKYIIKELTMISIPVTVLNVGYSPSNMTQLRIAPSIGLMRRHILMSETLLPLVCKAMNQKLKAKTEMKISVPKHI